MIKNKSILLIVVFIASLYTTAQEKYDWQISVSMNNTLFMVNKDLQLKNQINYRPSILLGLEFHLQSGFVAYFDIDMSLKEMKGLDEEVNLFGELNPNNNLVPMPKEESYYYNESFEINGPRFNFGLGYRIQYKNWRLTPQVGIGMTSISSVDKYHQFKEISTNNIYTSSYTVGRDYDDTLYNIQLRLKASIKVKGKHSILLALGYDYYLNRMKMKAEYRDYFDSENNTVNQNISFSRRPHSVSCSVGFAFGL